MRARGIWSGDYAMTLLDFIDQHPVLTIVLVVLIAWFVLDLIKAIGDWWTP